MRKETDHTEQEVQVVIKEEANQKIKSKEKKIKTISLLIEWEDKIKKEYGGTVAGFITAAIQEKMIRDDML